MLQIIFLWDWINTEWQLAVDVRKTLSAAIVTRWVKMLLSRRTMKQGDTGRGKISRFGEMFQTERQCCGHLQPGAVCDLISAARRGQTCALQYREREREFEWARDKKWDEWSLRAKENLTRFFLFTVSINQTYSKSHITYSCTRTQINTQARLALPRLGSEMCLLTFM